MQKVAVVTDSAASIPVDMMEELEINWVPYYIHRGSEVLRDMVSIKTGEFYQWLSTAVELPTTAAPGTGDYFKLYESLVEKGHRQIISIHMTSKSSGAYQAALDAKRMLLEKFQEVEVAVVDTWNVSMCHGWMAVEAAREALGGGSLQQVVNVVKKMIPVTQMIQTADTLKYLHMGGRIGKAGHLVGSMLSIKPLISMREGVIVPLGVSRSRQKAYMKMVEIIEKTVGKMGEIKAAYMHAAAFEEVDKLRELIESRLNVVETVVSELSPALGVHTGPGTAGICYYPVSVFSGSGSEK